MATTKKTAKKATKKTATKKVPAKRTYIRKPKEKVDVAAPVEVVETTTDGEGSGTPAVTMSNVELDFIKARERRIGSNEARDEYSKNCELLVQQQRELIGEAEYIFLPTEMEKQARVLIVLELVNMGYITNSGGELYDILDYVLNGDIFLKLNHQNKLVSLDYKGKKPESDLILNFYSLESRLYLQGSLGDGSPHRITQDGHTYVRVG